MNNPVPIDLLLVNPIFLNLNETERELMSPYFPLGLLYLAAFLRENDYCTEIFDGTFVDGIEDYHDSLEKYQPKVVGITAVQPNREMALKLADIAHSHGVITVLGGPDPTYTPDTYLSHPTVDLIIHHEGEATLLELLSAIRDNNWALPDLDDLPGVAYRDKDGEFKINPRRPYILDLDELPYPARDMIDIQKYLDSWREHHGYASLTISVARGCPYGCKYCQDAVHGSDFRIRSPESVVREVKTLMKTYPIDRLRVVDDVDGIDQEWIKEWAEIAETEGAIIPFEALYEVKHQDLPMLDIRDSL